MSEEKIKKAMPGRRDPTCFETQHAILIPKGTILRQEAGKAGVFTIPLAGGIFTIERAAAEADQATFKKVMTA